MSQPSQASATHLDSSHPADREPKIDRWSAVVDEITDDASARADRYPSESIVPEGGE